MSQRISQGERTKAIAAFSKGETVEGYIVKPTKTGGFRVSRAPIEKKDEPPKTEKIEDDIRLNNADLLNKLVQLLDIKLADKNNEGNTPNEIERHNKEDLEIRDNMIKQAEKIETPQNDIKNTKDIQNQHNNNYQRPSYALNSIFRTKRKLQL